jgi:hypothetical protein
MMIQALSPKYLARLFDTYVTPTNTRLFEVFIIRLAVLFFIGHLVILFLFNHVPGLYRGQYFNYLKAIYTPFSFILLYEVFLLVVILSESMTEFIGKQFEIITLITVRSFFHDIASIHMHAPIHLGDPEILSLGYDLVASLVMFSLTIIFHRMHSRHRDPDQQEALKYFIDLKKSVSVCLIAVLIVTSLYSFGTWISDAVPALLNKTEFPDPNTFFYLDFFNVMIYADVLLLIISFLYDSSFYTVVRNASFIISTILLRLSLNMERPMNHLVAIAAFAFSVAVMLILCLKGRTSQSSAKISC